MSTRVVTNQAELDAALAGKVRYIEIRSERGVRLRVEGNRGNSSVVARGNSSVVAWGNSSVEARGNSSVEAWENSSVEARENSSVVVIDVTTTETDPAAWCEYHGVEVVDGVATLFKAVNDRWTTDRGFDYSPGAKPEAPDWKPTQSCGGGLHFGPSPLHAKDYNYSATKFVEVGVRLDEMAVIADGGTAKAKAKRVVRACVEVDVKGKRVTA